jgi:hypothetical protein
LEKLMAGTVLLIPLIQLISRLPDGVAEFVIVSVWRSTDLQAPSKKAGKKVTPAAKKAGAQAKVAKVRTFLGYRTWIWLLI